MKNISPTFRAFLSAAGTCVYIILIATLMSYGSSLFGPDDTFLAPVFAIMLFVISATITGLLVLGKPIILYIDGARREAIQLFVSTLVWLVIFLLIIGVAMIIVP